MANHSHFPSPTDDALQESCSQSHSTRFGYDQSIRRTGRYTIASRPKTGEPTWEEIATGDIWTHSEVLSREGISAASGDPEFSRRALLD
jgi:hypothetical protein